ncbi:MAG: Ig-like domain-containing protein, partial [Thermoplasmatota archaeon]
TVVDDDAATDEDTATVTVSEEPNDPPSCTLSASPTAGTPPLDVTFSLSASDPDGSIDSWELDIDDDGTPEYSGSGMPPASQMHTYTTIDTYTARLTVVDDDAATDEDTATVTVSEEDLVPPEIHEVSVSPSPTAEAGENVVITANVTDDMNLADVRLVLTYPDDSTRNFSILQNVSGIDGTTYYCQQPYYDLGEYTFHIYAEDGAGNSNTSAEQSFTVEDTMPPVFSNVAATPSVANYNGAVNISAEITDAVGVEDVFLKIIDPNDEVTNTSIVGQVADNDTYYSETTYTMLGTYEYVFYAVDGEGNANTSSTKTFRVKDATPPEVTLTAPNGGENLTGDVDVTWNATDVATANDSELMVTLKYSADGGVSWQTIVTDTENDGSYEWDTDGLVDGVEYLIKISVTDPSNNQGTDLSDDEFTVDNTAPTLTLEKPTTNHLYLFDREILPILRDKAVIVGQITVSVNANDATSGMDRVSFLIDGVEKASDETTPYEWVWDDTVLFAHTLKVVAYDHAGNRAERSVSVTVYNI